jgi:uncharacterized protein (TIGR02996 family)
MTDRERGFLDAVLADAGDDVVRLIFADFLEDHGQPERGEFIRVQCEQVRLRASGYLCFHDLTMPPDCALCVLRRRERELLDARGDGWFLDFLHAIGQTHARVERNCWQYRSVNQRLGWSQFRRGFVASVSLTLAAFMAHAEAIFGAAPVEEVRLLDREPVLRYEGVCWLTAFGIGGVSDCHEPYMIPRVLARALKVKDHDGAALGPVAAFRHRKNAEDWLSAAAVAYGRNLALPAKEAVSP